ncbi:ribonucleoside-diphosphate reductase [Streptomyces sp. NPDC056549]|uniref:TSCPD domain-containing protein n=1 Tax=Streptomyces sp. NPDC056549 TaxID=3345864 RepID=UPI0036B413A5
MTDRSDVLDYPGQLPTLTRVKAPRRLHSTTWSFVVGQGKGYLTVGVDRQGRPADVQIRMAKQGSTLAGMMDTLSTTITSALRHGVPLETLVQQYIGMRFEPSGMTNDREIHTASSVMDYVGRRLAFNHLDRDTRIALNVLTPEEQELERVLAESGGQMRVDPDTDLVALAQSAPSANVTR